VTFESVQTRKELIDLARSLGTIYMHRDCDHDGVTHITATGTHTDVVGYLGLTTSALTLHTDRSSLANPPDLLLFLCERQAREGGESLFADGRLIYEVLKKDDPDVLGILSTPNTVAFSDSGNILMGSIFDRTSSDRIYIRFRYDGLGYFSAPLVSSLPILLDVFERCSFTFLLKPGQGYVLQNGRWLHGRGSFVGERVMYRILVTVDTEESSSDGIVFGFDAPGGITT
jgi:alpha-ketoglutarate-dependent taurine dioxygenase